MKWIALIASIFLAGCLTTGSRDQSGNVYPEVCRGELVCNGEKCNLAGHEFAIRNVSPQEMPLGRNGRPAIGFFQLDTKMSLISTASPNRWDTVRHEGCHAILGAWHN